MMMAVVLVNGNGAWYDIHKCFEWKEFQNWISIGESFYARRNTFQEFVPEEEEEEEEDRILPV